jgi:hypothetical protein
VSSREFQPVFSFSCLNVADCRFFSNLLTSCVFWGFLMAKFGPFFLLFLFGWKIVRFLYAIGFQQCNKKIDGCLWMPNPFYLCILFLAKFG